MEARPGAVAIAKVLPRPGLVSVHVHVTHACNMCMCMYTSPVPDAGLLLSAALARGWGAVLVPIQVGVLAINHPRSVFCMCHWCLWYGRHTEKQELSVCRGLASTREVA